MSTFFNVSDKSSNIVLEEIKNPKNEVLGFEIDTRPFTNVTEGKAEVLFPSSQDVFYNPVQEFNRDMSVAVLKIFSAQHKKKMDEINKLGIFKDRKKSLNEDFFSPDISKNPQHCNSDINGGVNNACNAPCHEENLKHLQAGVKDEDGIRILEALAASGLRSIRYAKEVGGVKEIITNDYSAQAVECMKINICHNKVDHIITPSHSDASMLMYSNRSHEKRFQAVDLDPYGSPHQFLDGAVQCVTDGGILLVTCTDMAVLCGNSPETCYLKYGALSIKSKACHEIALRIVLQCIESHANRYGRYIVPLLSMSIDFYVRVVVQVFTSQQKCKETFSKLAWIYQCVGCETITLHPLGKVAVNGKSVKYQLSHGPPVSYSCKHCGFRHLVAGPIWAAPIHNKNFLFILKNSLIEGDFATYRRMLGTITMMEEELTDVPLYYVIDKLASIAGISFGKMVNFRSALLNAGYEVSMSHACKASVKTNAPPEVVWDVVRAWEKLNPVNKDKMGHDRPGKGILEKEIKTLISFDLHPQAVPSSQKNDLLRFQIKPEPNWGPKCKSKTSIFCGDQDEKRKLKQGKKRKGLNSIAQNTPPKIIKELPINFENT